FDLEQPTPRGTIRFDGDMLRTSDGQPVHIELEIAIALTALPTRLLGESYNFLELDGAVGMKYTPYQLSGDIGRVRLAGADIVLFENRVDLGPAVLQRQMIKTRDKTGRLLHGLREIFTAKPELAARRTFHLNRAQVNVFLVALILLDVVLSTVAIVFPEHWS